MATYKDDLDILKAAEKDSNKLSLNAITELDNKGLLGMYGGDGGTGGGMSKHYFVNPQEFTAFYYEPADANMIDLGEFTEAEIETLVSNCPLVYLELNTDALKYGGCEEVRNDTTELVIITVEGTFTYIRSGNETYPDYIGHLIIGDAIDGIYGISYYA